MRKFTIVATESKGQQRVILYDTKIMNDQIKFLLRESGVFGIGVENAKAGIIGNTKKSFEKSGWIQIGDARLNRSFAKKFPLLNSVLFTKSNPEGEIQGQMLVGKFNTHEYRSTNESYTNAKELYADIKKFFTHYRSSDALAKYEVLGTSNFDEFNQLRTIRNSAATRIF